MTPPITTGNAMLVDDLGGVPGSSPAAARRSSPRRARRSRASGRTRAARARCARFRAPGSGCSRAASADHRRATGLAPVRAACFKESAPDADRLHEPGSAPPVTRRRIVVWAVVPAVTPARHARSVRRPHEHRRGRRPHHGRPAVRRAAGGEAPHGRGRLPGVPGRQRVERGRVEAAGPHRLGQLTHRASARPAARRCCTPTSAAAATYGIPFIVVPGNAAEGCRSTTPRTATRAIPVRSRSRRRRRSRAAGTATRDVLVAADRDAAISTSSTARVLARQPLGRRLRRELEPDVEHAAARWAGRRPTPPGCRSSPDSCATTRWRSGTSTTRCASPSRRRSAATSCPRRTRRRRRPTRRCRRWGCACG